MSSQHVDTLPATTPATLLLCCVKYESSAINDFENPPMQSQHFGNLLLGGQREVPGLQRRHSTTRSAEVGFKMCVCGFLALLHM